MFGESAVARSYGTAGCQARGAGGRTAGWRASAGRFDPSTAGQVGYEVVVRMCGVTPQGRPTSAI
jgi:hypothetical protein